MAAAAVACALGGSACRKRRTPNPNAQTQTVYPGQIPGMPGYPGQMPGQYPGQMPGQAPMMGGTAALMVPPPVATAPDNPALPVPPPGVMRQLVGSQ